MAYSLIALGSNLGDRAAQLRQAVEALAQLPETRLVARSQWHETAPVGGPAGQQAFLNGAALLSTSVPPRRLFGHLTRIEIAGGRKRGERWSARTLDLDLLLYDELLFESPELTIPHPRMAYRPFVLKPAAGAAPWMVHPESGWTVNALLEHLHGGRPSIAVAGEAIAAERIISKIRGRLDAAVSSVALSADKQPTVAAWSDRGDYPTLLIAEAGLAGIDKRQLRKMLNLPATGPVVWISANPAAPELDEALTAVQAVWPALAR